MRGKKTLAMTADAVRTPSAQNRAKVENFAGAMAEMISNWHSPVSTRNPTRITCATTRIRVTWTFSRVCCRML